MNQPDWGTIEQAYIGHVPSMILAESYKTKTSLTWAQCLPIAKTSIFLTVENAT